MLTVENSYLQKHENKSQVTSYEYQTKLQEKTISALTEPAPSCQCQKKIYDPLENPQKFNFGKFQGQCIDTCRIRPVALLNKDQNPEGVFLSLGNVFHFGKFYKLDLELNKVKSAEIGFETFFPGINHVFLRFHFDENFKGIKLHPQVDLKDSIITTRTIVLSSEGTPAKGMNYKLIESYFGNYLLVHRILTGEEMNRVITEKKHPVTFYKLNLAEKEIQDILYKGIVESDQKKFQSIYNLFYKNCSTSTLTLIDSEISTKSDLPARTWLQFEKGLPFKGPVGALNSLMSRKLVHQ